MTLAQEQEFPQLAHRHHRIPGGELAGAASPAVEQVAFATGAAKLQVLHEWRKRAVEAQDFAVAARLQVEIEREEWQLFVGMVSKKDYAGAARVQDGVRGPTPTTTVPSPVTAAALPP